MYSLGITDTTFLILLAQLPVAAFLWDGTLRKVFWTDASVRHLEHALAVSLFTLYNSTWTSVELHALKGTHHKWQWVHRGLKIKWREKISSESVKSLVNSEISTEDISISGNYLVTEKKMFSSKCAVKLPAILFTWR